MAEGKKNLPGEADKRKPFLLKIPERTVKEAYLSTSMDYLTEVMGELVLVARLTGRTGMPQRVYQAFNEVFSSAISLAEEKYGQDD